MRHRHQVLVEHFLFLIRDRKKTRVCLIQLLGRQRKSKFFQPVAQTGSQPIYGQRGAEVQKFDVIENLPIGLDREVRAWSVGALNQLVADTMTLRDMYKKHHWQVAGHTFYQLHLLFDKHHGEQDELVDTIAERIQILGGVSIAMAHDVAETTQIERPPKGREAVPVQISRLLDAHQVIIEEVREMARKASQLGDDGTNDMLISDALRTNEMQVWFVSEHLVDVPLVHAREQETKRTA